MTQELQPYIAVAWRIILLALFVLAVSKIFEETEPEESTRYLRAGLLMTIAITAFVVFAIGLSIILRGVL